MVAGMEDQKLTNEVKKTKDKVNKANTGGGSRRSKKTKQKQTYGLSTRAALGRLYEEIEGVLVKYEEQAAQNCFSAIRLAFVKRFDSPLGWFAIATTLVTATALLIAESYLAALLLAAILSIDLFVVIRENNLRRTEIFRKTRNALAEIRLAEQELCSEWQPFNYPHLCCPMSPCVSLQWTYRDGIIVNLPWALLVRGDHIVLRPGHATPGPCAEVEGKRSFAAHEIYGTSQVSDPPVKPVARAPLPNLVCCLQNTPYLDNLRTVLENSLKRPPTIYNQQRYLLVTKYIQQWGFICALCLTLLAALLRMHGFALPGPSKPSHHYWFIQSAAAAVIPLLPLIFPVMWISLNLWGMARLQCFLRTPQFPIAKDTEKSFEEDLDTPTFDFANISLMRSNVFRNWLQLWQGESDLLPRSANVVQVLGSITALCCVDKKGILSWPNPTAEKVFFLHEHEQEIQEENTNSQSSLTSDSEEPVNAVQREGGVMAEVLDLTHDQHCPFRLEFDDHEWKKHIKSLKPLGLAILLNTCSPLTHAHYAQFCGHVTAVAMLDKDLVPVTNRYEIVDCSLNSFLHGRCLCELAKLIGFTDHATDRFILEGQLASYRHLQPDVVRRDIRFARQLQLSSKVKVPFPHSLSVVMRENPGGYYSLFTQGTADMVLDCSDDFWDGKDLRPLSAQDRKRALDFYQRNALTAYCTAFAYRPLRHGINNALSGSRKSGCPIAYLELPPESKLRMTQVDKTHGDFECSHAKLSHSISTDSLLFSESKDEDINDVEACFEMQCHQVFIGMVTMQYQAQTDIVQLVEHLDRACIRFVHFSKENELRSRVFSEKMGLESGWNCHISLLSESDEKANSEAGGAASTQSPKKIGKKEAPNTAINVSSAHVNISATLTTTTITHPITTTTSSSTDQTNKNAETICITTTSHNSNTHETDSISIARNVTDADGEDDEGDPEIDCLLPPANLESTKNLSSSAPGAISDHGDFNMLSIAMNSQRSSHSASNRSLRGSNESLNINLTDLEHAANSKAHRNSHDSALDRRSISILTESTEQSAPVHFDLSNRAKLPRGIENIRPHLEKVDNVPLQVSLFTDCSAEATCQMLDIMQSYGEIVVCLGSSASNANSQIFQQGDCSIAMEPLYPQVCQDIAAYTEANLLNNKLRLLRLKKDINREADDGSLPGASDDLLESGLYPGNKNDELDMGVMCTLHTQGNTISPIYLSRMLNSLPCSISVRREDPLSMVTIIELSRRFSSGLWNCIQYWACCAGTLAVINMLSAFLSLPPILTPLMVIYLMCIPVPLIALALAHIDIDPKIMNRATGKKQTEYDSRVFGFVLWCYGCKFIAPILIIILTYCTFMAHPIEIVDIDEENLHIHLHLARVFSLLGVLLHLIVISASFVHRDQLLWQRNPFRNRIWAFTCFCILLVHSVFCVAQLLTAESIVDEAADTWPAILFLYAGSLISLIATEITKWQEIKINTRYQRRARLDFGTKLGMNSPF